jgi:hypothetical protein
MKRTNALDERRNGRTRGERGRGEGMNTNAMDGDKWDSVALGEMEIELTY